MTHPRVHIGTPYRISLIAAASVAGMSIARSVIAGGGTGATWICHAKCNSQTIWCPSHQQGCCCRASVNDPWQCGCHDANDCVNVGLLHCV